MTTPTADLCDEYGDAVRVLDGGFTSYGGVVAFGGPISTVAAFEDNSLVREALAEPGGGRVLVVAGGGSSRCAMVGGNLAEMAAANGWAGVVVDGCVRDVSELAVAPVGIRARGTCPRRSVKQGLGDRDVTVTAFFADAGEGRAQLKQLLDNCADETSHLKVTFVDPDKNPALAKQYGIRAYGTTVFASGDQTYRITDQTEEAVTNALVRVSREGRKTVYFLAGHGEHGLEDTQRSGYATAKKALVDQGFAVKDLLLLREAEVPADCDVLVIAGPTKPLMEQEVEAVRRYLDGGGRVLALLDPQTDPALGPVLEAWGVLLRDDVVIDTMSRLFGGSYTTPIITEYPAHEITEGFQIATFLPLARSLDKAEKLPDGVSYAPLARTSAQAWGETDLGNAKASFDPLTDHRGPLTLAALFSRDDAKKDEDAEEGGGQLLVVGDSDFADNTYFNFSGNGDLFQNLISYLSKEEDLIAIRPKDTKPSPLVLNPTQAATLFYATVVVTPLALVLAGLGIWWKRKNL